MGDNDSTALAKDSDREIQMEVFKFKLDIKKIFLDKFILAIIIGSFALLANRSFESYKNDLSLDRFNKEKKLQAVMEIKQSYAELSYTVMEMIEGRLVPNPAQVKARYGDCFKTINKWSFYFSPDEIDNLSACLWNYLGLTKIPISDWKNYEGYFATLKTNIRLICRSAIGLNQDKKYFTFTGIPEGNLCDKSDVFLTDNYKVWRTSAFNK